MVQWRSLNSQILLGVHGKTGNCIFLGTFVLMNVCHVRNSALSVEKTPVNALQISIRLTRKMTPSYTVVSITITRLGSASEFFNHCQKNHHSSLHSKHLSFWTRKLKIPPPQPKNDCHPSNMKTNYVSTLSREVFTRTESGGRKSSTYVLHVSMSHPNRKKKK